MTQWEYEIIEKTDRTVALNSGVEFSGYREALNTLGAEGWELVATTIFLGGADLFLKRPKP